MRDLPEVTRSLLAQTVQPNKVVFVDSGSTDGSKEFALQQGFNVIDYNAPVFNYSESLNLGMAACTSPRVLIISAHCILVEDTSVEKMIESIDVFEAAGVFGRQLPTEKSNPLDVRDLLTVFGRERIIYEQHPFFHNAFSLVERSVWEKVPFDDRINGIEDRLWALEVCRLGKKIVYEPNALVFHEHGLNQASDSARALRVCRALSVLHQDDVVKFSRDVCGYE
jgi:GT2 family glycosyltransferase